MVLVTQRSNQGLRCAWAADLAERPGDLFAGVVAGVEQLDQDGQRALGTYAAKFERSVAPLPRRLRPRQHLLIATSPELSREPAEDEPAEESERDAADQA